MAPPLECRHPLQIRVLGELTVVRGARRLPLPRSRKTRGLLAYLALNGREHHRDELCRLLFDEPDDPRAALRWSLTKLRPVLGSAPPALATRAECVALDRASLCVDLVELRRAVEGGSLDDAGLLRAEAALARGLLLGLDGAGGTDFGAWLTAERDRVRRLRVQVLEALVARLPPEEALPLARLRVGLHPLDDAGNISLLRLSQAVGGVTLARSDLARMLSRYRAERVPDGALLVAWQSLAEPAAHPRPGATSLGCTAPGTDAELEPPDQPSVAVAGFQTLGAGPRRDILAHGLGVDLTTRLSHLPQLFVVSSASASVAAAGSASAGTIGRRLGVRYLISGATQRVGRRVRITATLLDASRDQLLWSDHFDRPLDDLFALQDEIAGAIVAVIAPAIERAEMQRAILAPPSALSAWECFHRGLWHGFRFTVEDNEAAHQLFERARALDPKLARAYAGLSFTHYSRAFLGTGPTGSSDVERAVELAQQSVALAGRDSLGHWCLGLALFLAREHDAALTAIDRSLDANPSFALGHYAKGFIGAHAGRELESLDAVDRARRLSPFDPLLFAMLGTRALSLAAQGHFDEAETWAIRAAQAPNAHFHMHAIRATCHQLVGHDDEARDSAERLLRERPDYSLDLFRRSFPQRDESRRASFVDAMRAAGIPEHASAHRARVELPPRQRRPAARR